MKEKRDHRLVHGMNTEIKAAAMFLWDLDEWVPKNIESVRNMMIKNLDFRVHVPGKTAVIKVLENTPVNSGLMKKSGKGYGSKVRFRLTRFGNENRHYGARSLLFSAKNGFPASRAYGKPYDIQNGHYSSDVYAEMLKEMCENPGIRAFALFEKLKKNGSMDRLAGGKEGRKHKDMFKYYMDFMTRERDCFPPLVAGYANHDWDSELDPTEAASALYKEQIIPDMLYLSGDRKEIEKRKRESEDLKENGDRGLILGIAVRNYLISSSQSQRSSCVSARINLDVADFVYENGSADSGTIYEEGACSEGERVVSRETIRVAMNDMEVKGVLSSSFRINPKGGDKKTYRMTKRFRDWYGSNRGRQLPNKYSPGFSFF